MWHFKNVLSEGESRLSRGSPLASAGITAQARSCPGEGAFPEVREGPTDWYLQPLPR